MATAAVIWLHGLGDTGAGWSHVSGELGSGLEHVKWIFPTANVSPVTCNNGYPMPSWFDILEIPLTPTTPADPTSTLAAVKQVHEYIREQEAAGIAAGRIVVGGFSQGGALALLSTAQYPKQLAGTAVFSGWVAMKEVLTDATAAAKETPVLWCHGTADPVVLHSCSIVGKKQLDDAGFQSVHKDYRGMQHSACPEEMEQLKHWLLARLPK
eukprot:jgi/Chlat1/2789/Chrsp187S02953